MFYMLVLADVYHHCRHLSLICIMGKNSGIEKRVVVDYNVGILQEAVAEVFSLSDL